MSSTMLLPKMEQSGNVKIITFTGDKVRDVESVLAHELEGRTGELGDCHLLLDFTNVEYINSLELATLVTLHKRVKALGGRLTLFNLNAEVYEVFVVTRLQTLLGICRAEAPQVQDEPTHTAVGGNGHAARATSSSQPTEGPAHQ
jgi:anti-sigma B factor antagonist